MHIAELHESKRVHSRMCIAFFHWSSNDEGKFLVCHNRDEFLSRPTASTHWWEPHDCGNNTNTNSTNENNENQRNKPLKILAPRDLKSGGTWIGYDHDHGRCAFVTNIREARDVMETNVGSSSSSLLPPPTKSRGQLVLQFLQSNPELSAREFVEQQQCQDGDDEWRHMAGFNLILFSGRDLVYVTNRSDHYTNNDHNHHNNHSPILTVQPLQRGVAYGISNSGLERPYEKVTRGLNTFRQILRDEQQERSKPPQSRDGSNNNNDTENDKYHSSFGAATWYQPYLERLLGDTQPSPPHLVPTTPGFCRRDEAALSSIRVPTFGLLQRPYGTRTAICLQIVPSTASMAKAMKEEGDAAAATSPVVQWVEQQLDVATQTWQAPTVISNTDNNKISANVDNNCSKER
mmetsp:Transcript_24775/g.56794  ORF Transcript_24775/g.56794 Transcript_24775/m.56794 type:complete len:404 (+) Transcript_24775:10-1221(+)